MTITSTSSATSTPTPSPTVTATVTATPTVTLALHGVEPAVVSNEQETQLTITGTGFQPGARVRLGDIDLDQVTVLSETTLTAMLPAGWCGGRYPLSVRHPDGRTVEGPSLQVTATPRVMLGHGAADTAVSLAGSATRVAVPLPPVQLVGACAGQDWPVVVTVRVERVGDDRPNRLRPHALRLENSAGDLIAQRTLETADHQAATVIRLPGRLAAAGTSFQPVLDVTTPANAYLGRYSVVLTASLEESRG